MTQSELNTLVVNTLTEVIPLLPEGEVKDMAYRTMFEVMAFNPVVPKVQVCSPNLPLMKEVKNEA